MYIKTDLNLFNTILKIEIGKMAKNTASSVFLDADGTSLLITVVYTNSDETDFLPLKVEYFERFYANGKIPFNYFKREGKPSEREILISRLIDRSVRSMLPKRLAYEIQITVTVLSINKEINPDIIALNGVSLALALSGLPFDIVSSARICVHNNSIIINPKSNDMKNATAELILSCTNDKVIMMEGSFSEISENTLIDCIVLGLKESNIVIKALKEIKISLKTKDYIYEHSSYNLDKNSLIKYEKILADAIYDNYNKEHIKNIKTKLLDDIEKNNINKTVLTNILDDIEKKIIRNKILNTKKRLDNRFIDDIRNISAEINLLKFVHGSALFTRGDTQSLACVTLGTYKDSQLIDCPFFSCYKNNFILHYNFPPYAVNEIGAINIIKRREIGHGNLAKNSLISVLPNYDEFPYVVRVVSEIMESNGSSSMATVCSSSLALMDAGVPIKKHVAGISVGLIKDENNYVTMLDISSEEDYFGDMDFKLAGTLDGITSIQMDLKIKGLEIDLIKNIIHDATKAIKKIINIMTNIIDKPRDSLPITAPKIKVLHINKNKIKDIIGKNGSIIKELTDKYECEINISNDGILRLSSNYQDNIEDLVNEIKNLIKDVKPGTIFKGKVTRIVQFGAFINITNKTDGLLHISKINKQKISNPEWDIKEGDLLDVVISNIDNDGKISLNILDDI